MNYAKKLETFIEKHTSYLVIALLAVGVFVRIYKLEELFLYTHDHDLASWFVRDVVANKHLRLIGQETSTKGIFIGPLYYYLLVPFYLAGGMKATAGLVFTTILGLVSGLSFYYVFSNVHSKLTGLVAMTVSMVSYYMIFNDREFVPTVPVIMWTAWMYYALDLIIKKDFKRGFLVTGILLGLIWHLNFALILTAPLILLALLLSKKVPVWKDLIPGAIAALGLSIPLILFELRHGFIQVRSFIEALTTDQHDVVSGMDKFLRTLHLASKNIAGLLWQNPPVKYEYFLIGMLVVGLYLMYKKILSRTQSIIIVFWIVLYIGFFSVYSKVLSEYYLNGLQVVWIALFSVFITYLLRQKRLMYIGVILLGAFIGLPNFIEPQQPI